MTRIAATQAVGLLLAPVALAVWLVTDLALTVRRALGGQS